MLLRFRVANHHSIRDVAELSLASVNLTGTRPADGDWVAATTRVAGIYGANASGKSNLLDALHFAGSAVRNSATAWGGEDTFPHHPFALDEASRTRTSLYEFDLVASEVRYTYGFESAPDGIHKEWLYSYPTGRKRVLFERSGLTGDEIEFGRHLPGENMRIARLMRPNSLYLSTARNSNHEFLSRIYLWFRNAINYAAFTEMDKQSRLQWIHTVLEHPQKAAQVVEMLKFADLGIVNLTLETEELDERTKSLISDLLKLLEGVAPPPKMSVEDILENISKKISFTHVGAGSKTFSLPLSRESSGTVAWLSLVVPALIALEYGQVLVVDELDSSLHPRLAAALVSMFKDPKLNPRGAQLIFTSHDTNLLEHLAGPALSRDEVWFTEKAPDGATELFALTEFPGRPTDNIERRYLQGRYGAVPMVSPDDLHAAVLRQDR
ncbi:hypothetical protein HNP84_008393 [Thermocatellispora tengchongensis]|uniref:ATPase AAA-type core domain-containing protein n=1 Tax=Thermocatellispora tengchongensis TaxID=1073253 RepID=A0A840PI35_9ACTN|nr:ATP-binding protein [Thermocatellispora tengchongensis]MBB5138639.1 hypothetical protein [Thermocatellispora tengchongensis]